MNFSLFYFFKLKCISVFSAVCRGQSCIIVRPLTHSCSVSVSDGGSLSEHVAASSPGGPALILPQLINFIWPSHRKSLQEFFSPALHESVAFQMEDNSRLNIDLRSDAHTKYLSDTHSGVVSY